MAEVEIRLTAPGDAEHLGAHLRPADAREVRAYGHTDVVLACQRSVACSVLCWSGFINGELAAILGCAPVSLVSGIGSPWMLGTPVLDAHARVLVRTTPGYIAKMLQAFPHLVNHVHTENVTSARWLRRLGFTVHPAQPFGALGEPFHPFEMRA